MRSDRRLELKVGILIASGIVLALLVIWNLGSAQELFSEHDSYYITLPTAEGVSPGSKVTISGVDAGSVDTLVLDIRNKNVRVKVDISKKFEGSIRGDSFAEVTTAGVLGDKLIAIEAGSPTAPKLAVNSQIPAQVEASLGALVGKGSDLAISLTKLTRDLDRLTLHLNTQLEGNKLERVFSQLSNVLGKIDHGTGTLGALVNDPSMYDDVKSLVGEVNKNRIMRNLVRKSVEDSRAKKKEPG